MMTKDSKVLVIGGGYAGARVTQDLAKAGFKRITLIDKKDYFEVTYATMRALAQPALGNHSRHAYADFIKGEFTQGVVAELAPTSAQLENGSSLDFDIAVLATGSSYPTFPIGKSQTAMHLSDRNAEVSKAHEQLVRAKNVLIIGGGIVGVELAGEIADPFPDKRVTLAHSGDRLLSELKPKASTIAEQKLNDLGVRVLCKTRVTENDEVYKQSDLIYNCVGLKPNTALMDMHFSSSLDEQSRIKVDSQFRVEGTENIFALGDCANIPEGKLGYLADQQAGALAKNIIAMSSGKSCKNYKANPMMALVPIGHKQGLVQLPFAVTTLGFMVNMKQKDMFIAKAYKALGVKK